MTRFLEEDDHDLSVGDHSDHDHELETEEKGNLTGIKVGIIFALLFAGLFVFFPYTQFKPKQKEQKKKECCKGRFFSISNCFAAGMLFSMALCHILPIRG
jgi:tetrahydromethanopterin S-methyltransferase subunit F